MHVTSQHRFLQCYEYKNEIVRLDIHHSLFGGINKASFTNYVHLYMV